jgi:hypothetical protein
LVGEELRPSGILAVSEGKTAIRQLADFYAVLLLCVGGLPPATFSGVFILSHTSDRIPSIP